MTFLGLQDSPRKNEYGLKSFFKSRGLPIVDFTGYPAEETIPEHYFELCTPQSRPKRSDGLRLVDYVIGNVPNILPRPIFAWAIDKLAGKRIVVSAQDYKKESFHQRIFVVHTEDLSWLTRAVLFDVLGFWGPISQEQQSALQDYLKSLEPGWVGRKGHFVLPACVTVTRNSGGQGGREQQPVATLRVDEPCAEESPAATSQANEQPNAAVLVHAADADADCE
jgi:hypothetical protein